MVYILAANSVHRPIDALSPEQHSKCKENVYAIPGLCLNLYAKNPRKTMQILFPTNLKDKTEVNSSHDVLNKSIYRHRSNKSDHQYRI